ncbi:MarR family transcriptional regulator [Streptomyces roseolus]|uniref:MarR family transcriptional regulator n=1 Tax=Streptomyces roseolus TaxID=67358 RepID=UPI0036648CD2
MNLYIGRFAISALVQIPYSLEYALLSGTSLPLQFSAVILFAVGALNAVLGAVRTDFGLVSTSLCLCVCAAGLFGEDLLQRGYRRDRVVLAYVAARPGIEVDQVAHAVQASQPVAARSLERLKEDGLLVHGGADAAPAARGYRLASQ